MGGDLIKPASRQCRTRANWCRQLLPSDWLPTVQLTERVYKYTTVKSPVGQRSCVIELEGLLRLIGRQRSHPSVGSYGNDEPPTIVRGFHSRSSCLKCINWPTTLMILGDGSIHSVFSGCLCVCSLVVIDLSTTWSLRIDGRWLDFREFWDLY